MTDLTNLARQAEQDITLIACLLARYAAAQRLDDPALAVELGCPLEKLPVLKLCKRPRGWHRAADIQRIAAYAGCNAAALTQVLDEAEQLPPPPRL